MCICTCRHAFCIVLRVFMCKQSTVQACMCWCTSHQQESVTASLDSPLDGKLSLLVIPVTQQAAQPRSTRRAAHAARCFCAASRRLLFLQRASGDISALNRHKGLFGIMQSYERVVRCRHSVAARHSQQSPPRTRRP